MKQVKTNSIFIAAFIVAMFTFAAMFSSCTINKGVAVCHEDCYFDAIANPNSRPIHSRIPRN